MDGLEKQVLKGVSRSFYLSLQLLPRPMRGAASLGYLLARISDTIADAAAVPSELRLSALQQFQKAIEVGSELPRWPISLLNAISDLRERHLMECTGEVMAWFGQMPTNEAELIRGVIMTIIGGQSLDLERFGHASGDRPVALTDEAELDDYTWRVAGCVGEFWTKLGLTTMGAAFSHAPEDELLRQGIAYGKGLQLVNILRDISADLAVGRCYLPVRDPKDLAVLLECHAACATRATAYLQEGLSYAGKLNSRRLRAASVMPAWIGEMTLDRIRGADWKTLESHVKVSRGRIYRTVIRSFFYPASDAVERSVRAI
ncbi:MAG: phytoene/squalene synthase family protein [Akkermansiaceae bacterium]|nr:phytoene/squalene synthase family protein [Akkermansiaceae bacterium]